MGQVVEEALESWDIVDSNSRTIDVVDRTLYARSRGWRSAEKCGREKFVVWYLSNIGSERMCIKQRLNEGGGVG